MSNTSMQLGPRTTPEAIDRRTIRATAPANPQEPDILDGQNICEHGGAAPDITNTVSAVQEPAASGAPAPTPLSPDELGRLGARLALALVLAQYAAGQRVLPSPAGQPLSAPDTGADLQRGPAGVPPAPAGCGGDGGGRSSVVTNTPYTEMTQGGQTCSTDLPAIGG